LSLSSLLDQRGTGLGDITAYLEGLNAADRLIECVGLSAVKQKRLWELASARPWPGEGELVPAGQDTAVFAGRNSLRMFSHFQKRFARHGTEIAGYNVHLLGWLIGPGYFIVEAGSAGMPLRFDYKRVPRTAPPGWPRVSDNSSAFARPVYGGLLDQVAWVSADVLVGAAFRERRSLGSYFVLARSARKDFVPSRS
jgi:hypothetical protein